MKILHLYNLHRFRGGADNAALAMVRLQRSRGLEVRCLEYDSRDLAPGLGGRLAAFANGLYGRGALRRLDALLAEFGPDVIHAHKLYPMISPWALRLGHRRGIPVVMSLYDYQVTCPVGTHVWHGAPCVRCVEGGEQWGVLRNCRGSLPESAAYALRQTLARRLGLYREHVSAFVTPTRFSGRWLCEHAAIPAQRVHTIPFAFDLPEPAADPGRGEYLAFAGRLAPEKGIAVLLEAARLTGLPLRLAGDAAVLPGAALPPNVELVETSSRAELYAFYRRARALLVPSLWFETFPLVIGEAMSLGLPVIASRIGGLPEIVRDGSGGLLVAPGDARDLARAATRLWEDASLARELGAGARRFIGEHASAEACWQGVRALYEGLRR